MITLRIEVPCHSGEQIVAFKKKLARETGVPVHEQALLIDDIVLRDSSSLHEPFPLITMVRS